MKRQLLALHDQDDFTALKSIRSQKTIWMSAGQRPQPPTGKSSSFISKHDFQGRVWCLASGWVGGVRGGGGGREQRLLWQVIKFEMPTQCSPGTGVENMSRNSQTLCSQVSWHRRDKYHPRSTTANDTCHLGCFYCASHCSISLDVCIRPEGMYSPFQKHFEAQKALIREKKDSGLYCNSWSEIPSSLRYVKQVGKSKAIYPS